MTSMLKVEELDDYKKASLYLIDKALTTPSSSGGGFMLRAVKTLMDKAQLAEVDRTKLHEWGSPGGLPLGWRGRILRGSKADMSRPDSSELMGLLTKAVELIKVWHNAEAEVKLGHDMAEKMWEIYYHQSPEMKEIRQALLKEGK